MTLYEIDAAILAAIANGTDPETGENNNLDEWSENRRSRTSPAW